MESKQTCFTTGKMEHIFQFEPMGKRNLKYTPNYTSDEAKEALNNFEKIYMKIDGSCGALIRTKDGWRIYNRFDDSKNKFKGEVPEGYIALPQGGNSDRYEGHRYYLRLLAVPVPPEGGKLKGEDAFVYLLYQRVFELEKNGELTNLPDFNSIELVGKNFNNTPGVVGNGIVLHSEQTIELPTQERPKSPEEWLKFLSTVFQPKESDICMEGVVLEYRGKWWKIRAEHICDGKKAYLPPKLL